MKRFLIQVITFSCFVLLSMVAVFSIADGTTDAFYAKFTSPKQTSLIIGSSRAAQGIQPKILDSIFLDTKVYNYAFTITHAPYGEAYLKSIKKKIDPKTKNGLFILEVNPWSVSERHLPNGGINFWGQNSIIAKTDFVNLPVNIEYLIESYSDRNVFILRNKVRKGLYHTYFVNDDGWLEVSIESDLFSTELRTKNKVALYKGRLSSYNGLSEYRLSFLEQTITFLKQYGDVYLVRMPVVDEMKEVESLLALNFDDTMEQISHENQVPYLNFISFSKDFQYTDGQHLTINSSRIFSLNLAQYINNKFIVE